MDWGVPNWLDAGLYPQPTGPFALLDWAWQFLRRNHEYRRVWLDKVAPFLEEDGALSEDYVHPAEFGKFGLSLAWPHSPADDHRGEFDFAATWVKEIRRVKGGGSRNVRLADHEVAYVFDLSKPLEPQIINIRKQVDSTQKRWLKKTGSTLEPVRARTDKYVIYLRILDADDAGALDKEIGSVLYQNLSGDQLRDTLRKHRDAARSLRDGGYRDLIESFRRPGK